MPNKDEMVAAYVKHTADLRKLETATEMVKKQRSELVKELLGAFGKGPYMIEGAEKVISATKIGTYFLTDKDKWKKAGPRKPRAKKAIIDGQIVEIPVEGAGDTEAQPVEAEPVEAQPAVEIPSVAAEEPITVETPAPPAAAKPVDPLEAALAELMES